MPSLQALLQSCEGVILRGSAGGRRGQLGCQNRLTSCPEPPQPTALPTASTLGCAGFLGFRSLVGGLGDPSETKQPFKFLSIKIRPRPQERSRENQALRSPPLTRDAYCHPERSASGVEPRKEEESPGSVSDPPHPSESFGDSGPRCMHSGPEKTLISEGQAGSSTGVL